MCSGNSNKFCYHYHFTCGYDKLCRKSILYFTGWCTGCNTNWYSGRNIFINCRINDQCSDGCDYSKFKHSRNLYGYVYNGCRRWMRCTNCYYFSNNNYFTCGNDKLCRKSFLYFTGWCTGCNTDGYSGWNLFFYCGINDQRSDRCDYSKFKHCRNLYGYLYNDCCRWMCCTDSYNFRDYNALPVATFSYAGTPYCQNAANPSPTFSGGGVAGTFSSTAGLVFVSTATGQVDLSASTPGTYTVTNTIATSGGCAAVTATSSITITHYR